MEFDLKQTNAGATITIKVLEAESKVEGAPRRIDRPNESGV
jgi:hypothetical protein